MGLSRFYLPYLIKERLSFVVPGIILLQILRPHSFMKTKMLNDNYEDNLVN